MGNEKKMALGDVPGTTVNQAGKKENLILIRVSGSVQTGKTFIIKTIQEALEKAFDGTIVVDSTLTDLATDINAGGPDKPTGDVRVKIIEDLYK